MDKPSEPIHAPPDSMPSRRGPSTAGARPPPSSRRIAALRLAAAGSGHRGRPQPDLAVGEAPQPDLAIGEAS
jgi:hypothetical protein